MLANPRMVSTTNQEAQLRAPSILYIHGEQVCYGETFFYEMQVSTANGYGVILLNLAVGKLMVRSLFAQRNARNYGNKDYQDCS